MLVDRVSILGVGLIGGSLARVLKKKNICREVTGFARNEDSLQKAVDMGVIDDYSLNPAEAVAGADMIVLATPLMSVQPLLSQIKNTIKTGAIITDVGSAKRSVVDAARKELSSEQLSTFVPGHPIAGKEKTGVEASSSELFNDHLVLLTPITESTDAAVRLVQAMWESAGARVSSIDTAHHDTVLAATSHLPHMLAYALVDCLANMDVREEIFNYAAGGFADFSRIASSSPEMWHDVCLANKENLLQVLNQFDSHLAAIKKAIESDNSDKLLQTFSNARDCRNRFIEKLSQGNDSAES